MRRFQLTSPNFKGTAELLFDETERLVRFDVSDTDMLPAMVHSFKAKIPARIQDMETCFAGTSAMVAEADYAVTFDEFWHDVRKKVNKPRCLALWNKLNRIKQIKAKLTQKDYYACLDRTGRKEADPETYLRQEYWQTDWKIV